MTDERIINGLTAKFERHRLVFWYDAKQEMRETFDALDLPDVVKLEINNNEFAIKYQVLHQQPEDKFLIYKFGPEPENYLDNWLLDLQLGHGRFSTEQVQLWLDELQLAPALADTLNEHDDFFRSRKRMDALKALIAADEDALSLKFKMLLVCTQSQQDMEGVITTLFAEHNSGDDKTWKLLCRCNLEDFFWGQLKRRHGYEAETPSLADFIITLFKSSFAKACGEQADLNSEAHLLFRRWKNDRNNQACFETLSRSSQDVLGIQHQLAGLELDTLIEVDYFEQIDRHIIQTLISQLCENTISRDRARNICRRRRNAHWHEEFRHLYEAIYHAAGLLGEISESVLGISSFADGFNRYQQSWYKIDLLYRKFIFHYEKSAQVTLFASLYEQVENRYENDFLLKVNDIWQQQIDALESWHGEPVIHQRDFFKTFIQPLRQKGVKAVVIISDALRYEIGQELLSLILERDRFDADIHPMLSSAPSYTQLGMAALLPHDTLEFLDQAAGTISFSGQATAGLENRKTVLEAFSKDTATTAIHSTDLMALKTDKVKELVRDHDVIYVYHNVIDATGDSSKTEDAVFEATERALEQLSNLVRKLTSGNAKQLILTCDHGFIYQHRKITDSDYLNEKPSGDIKLLDRRFVIGEKLQETENFKKFSAGQLGISGSEEILFPKSINRLRKSGSSARYVHGGLSLQEIVLPVLKIRKGEVGDVTPVSVIISPGNTKTITTSQLAVRLYQEDPVTEKNHARTLRVGMYSSEGVLLSDSQIHRFDSESDNPRDRESQIRLLLTKSADDFDGQEVVLRLEEQHGNTSHYSTYREQRYVLNRSLGNDFDL